MRGTSALLRSAAFGAAGLLTACGGGGGSGGINSTPTPIAAVTPAPTAAPTSTTITAAPATSTPVNYDTAEYRATVGAVTMNALAAYSNGATGKGIGLAVIDTGIDLESPEFDNRISSASAAVGGQGTVDDQSGHGTAVAFTAAGRRNGTGTHGVAFEANVIAIRADRTGTCSAGGDESSCKFSTDTIAAGVDAARAAGARVINMSLGGSAMPQNLQSAIGRATAAGIVVVIAAGNDGTDNPDSFANVATTANARNAVIVAGSIGAGGTLSSFSDKAGSFANVYLTAVGEKVRAPNADNQAYSWEGTSFAAPQISGAVALLAQAFPNLTGAQIVDLLLTTARDAGAAGTDAVYGRGILDLTRAFQPVGATSVAGNSSAAVSPGAGVTSAPFGDATPTGMGAVILDGYDRAFATDLARTIARHAPSRTIAASLTTRNRQVATAIGGTAVAMTLAPARGGGVLLEPTRLTSIDADASRAVAATVTQRLGKHTSFGLSLRSGAQGLSAQMAGRAEPAFLVAQADGVGFDSLPRSAAALRHQFGALGLTASAENGDVLSAAERASGRDGWRRTPYDRMALTLDRRAGPVALSLTGTRMVERETLLGARLGSALGAPGGTSWFADAAARLDAGKGWSLGGSIRQGWTTPQVHGFAGGGRLRTNAWAADIGKDGLFGGDSWGLRVAQPLRVASGGVDLTLPTYWDYAAQAVTGWTAQRLTLAPTGRELDVEMRYARPLAGGSLQTNLFWRRNPGNWASLPTDRGAAVRWAVGF